MSGSNHSSLNERIFHSKGAMMSKLKIALMALAVSMTSNFAGAATQGTLGPTSTGTFTNTFSGNAARQVQVLGLQDAVMTPASGLVASGFGTTHPGVIDKFCVVDTSGGAVKLTVTGADPMADYSTFVAKSATGATLNFQQSLLITGGASAVVNLNTTGLTVPAASVVTSAGSCGTGNLSKSIILPNGAALPTSSEVYTEVMTIVATPV